MGVLGRLYPSELTWAQASACFRRLNIEPPNSFIKLDPSHILTDKEFGTCLGFNSLLSIDFNDSEGSEIIQNLNVTPPAPEWRGVFDFLYTNGTLEHIFDMPNVLENCWHFLAVGGVIVHCATCNNQIEHGFYQFSPTFFFDYYAANQYKILDCFIVQFQLAKNGALQIETPQFLKYNSFEQNIDFYGKMNDGLHDVLFIAQKTAETTPHVIPTQFYYRRQSA